MKKWLIITIVLLLGVIIYMYLHSRAREVEPTPIPTDTVGEITPPVEATHEELFTNVTKKEIKDENDFLIVNIKYPAFDNIELSTGIENVVEAELRQFKKDISFDNFPVEERERIAEFGYKYTFDADYTLYEGRGVSTVLVDFSTYTGGAHGAHYLRSLNYINTGERITIGDIFKSETNYLAKLSEISRIKIKEKLAENVSSWMEEGTAPITDNFNTFYMDTNGMLHIVFQPYQVGPWATGVVDIAIDVETELGEVIGTNFLTS